MLFEYEGVVCLGARRDANPILTYLTTHYPVYFAPQVVSIAR